MATLEKIIAEKLVLLEPSFDFNDIDKMILKLCTRDFMSYVVYIKTNHKMITQRESFIVPSSFNSESIFSSMFLILDEFTIMDNKDDINLIESWTEWWFTKYKKRVKISFKNDIPEIKQSNEA